MGIKISEEKVLKILLVMISGLYLDKFGEEKTSELFKEYSIDIMEEERK